LHINLAEWEHPDLNPHGRRWEELENVLIDPSAGKVYNQDAYIRWGALAQMENKTEMDYFNLFYPFDSLEDTIKHTNTNLASKGYSEITKGELLRYFGIRLAMCVQPVRGPISTYWNETIDPNGVELPMAYGKRFKMARHRFENITSCLSFNTPVSAITTSEVSVTILSVINVVLCISNINFIHRIPGIIFDH
jgi:hypothetical protein